jgi:hypothetical protein
MQVLEGFEKYNSLEIERIYLHKPLRVKALEKTDAAQRRDRTQPQKRNDLFKSNGHQYGCHQLLPKNGIHKMRHLCIAFPSNERRIPRHGDPQQILINPLRVTLLLCGSAVGKSDTLKFLPTTETQGTQRTTEI